MAVTLTIVALPTMRPIPPGTRIVKSLREAEALLERNRETWRAALVEGETSFAGLIADAEREPVKSIEHPRDGWGDDGIETGRASLRAMRAAQAAE